MKLVSLISIVIFSPLIDGLLHGHRSKDRRASETHPSSPTGVRGWPVTNSGTRSPGFAPTSVPSISPTQESNKKIVGSSKGGLKSKGNATSFPSKPGPKVGPKTGVSKSGSGPKGQKSWGGPKTSKGASSWSTFQDDLVVSSSNHTLVSSANSSTWGDDDVMSSYWNVTVKGPGSSKTVSKSVTGVGKKGGSKAISTNSKAGVPIKVGSTKAGVSKTGITKGSPKSGAGKGGKS